MVPLIRQGDPVSSLYDIPHFAAILLKVKIYDEHDGLAISIIFRLCIWKKVPGIFWLLHFALIFG